MPTSAQLRKRSEIREATVFRKARNKRHSLANSSLAQEYLYIERIKVLGEYQVKFYQIDDTLLITNNTFAASLKILADGLNDSVKLTLTWTAEAVDTQKPCEVCAQPYLHMLPLNKATFPVMNRSAAMFVAKGMCELLHSSNEPPTYECEISVHGQTKEERDHSFIVLILQASSNSCTSSIQN